MKTIKTIFLSLLTVVIFCTTTFAQTNRDYLELAREAIAMEKKMAVMEVMEFTDEQSGPFWTLYNEYQLELYKVHDKRVAVIKDFADNYEKMTDEKADEIWTAAQAYKHELLKLQKRYYSKFKKILPATKVVCYLQLENKIDVLINAELVDRIPLLEAK